MTPFEEFSQAVRRAWEPMPRTPATPRPITSIAAAARSIAQEFAIRYDHRPVFCLGMTAAQARAAHHAGHWVISVPDSWVPDDAVLYASGFEIGESSLSGRDVDVPIVPTGLEWLPATPPTT